MVERYRKGKRKKKLLGSHQKCWVWGRNTVLEILRAGRWPVVELHLADRLPPSQRDEPERLARQWDVPLTVEPFESLTQRCHSKEHQGYLVKMTPYPYSDAETILQRSLAAPLFVVLDAIQDPYNFGAIVRSADGLGIDAVFVPREGQSEVTSLVARSSAGAVNYVDIAQVGDLIELAHALHQRGLALVAAVEDAPRPVFEARLDGPAALVIGNEGRGIRPELLALCDEQIRIPQVGHVESLNAAVSAGILFYEARRQRSGVPAGVHRAP